MKRIWIAVPLLFAFIIGISLTCILLLRSTEKKAMVYIDNIEVLAFNEDYSECEEELMRFSDFWERRRRIYLFFVRHSEMHDIEIGIEQMIGFAQCRDRNNIIGELYMLETTLEHISISELPLIENIL